VNWPVVGSACSFASWNQSRASSFSAASFLGSVSSFSSFSSIRSSTRLLPEPERSLNASKRPPETSPPMPKKTSPPPIRTASIR
jgi:hypothetical protein